MENRRSRRHKKHMALFLILLAALLFVTAGALFFSQSGESRVRTSYPDVDGLDPAAHDLAPGLLERALGVKQNDKDEFSYSVRRKLSFDAKTGTGEVEIVNPPENRYLMAAELTLAKDGAVLHRTGYLKPGQGIDTITLADPPEPGSYEATAYFCAIDFETLGLLGILEQPVTLVVE